MISLAVAVIRLVWHRSNQRGVEAIEKASLLLVE